MYLDPRDVIERLYVTCCDDIISFMKERVDYEHGEGVDIAICTKEIANAVICNHDGQILPAFITMYTNAEWVMNLFTNNANIIQRGSEFIVAYSPDCILLCLVFCINGFMNGCGRTTFTMTNNVSSTLFVRIPLIYIATSLFAVGLALPIATAPQITFALIYFYSGKWKKSIINNRRKLS